MVRKKGHKPVRSTALACLIGVVLAVSASCSRPGLVRDVYSGDFYQIPKRLPENRLEKNPRFIIYGDNRPGWMGSSVFLNADSWLTWKQLYLPIAYQAYLVGTGVIGGVNLLRHTPDYGHGNALRVRDAIYERARGGDIDFIVNTGDIVTDGRRPKNWKVFLEQYTTEAPVVLEYPFLPVVGNHEHANDSTYALANYADVFDYPPFYVFECPDVDFFIVDSNYILDQYQLIDDDVQDRLFGELYVAPPGSREPAWLEGKLAESEKIFKIVVMHHPPLAFGKHHDNWSKPQWGRDLEDKRRRLLTLFVEQGVQVVFCGHQHMYERNSLRHTRSSGEVETMHIVVTGGGGAPLHRAYDEQEVERLTRYYSGQGLDTACLTQLSTFNYCVVDVTPSQIMIEAFAVSKSDDENGRSIDRFIIPATTAGGS